MSENTSRKLTTCFIYAIVTQNGKAAFVGKSSAKDPRSRFYVHLRGECSYTKDIFGPDGYVTKSLFLILESSICPDTASLHIIAWARYFKEHGYTLLLPPKSLDMANQMLPETQRVYDTVCVSLPLETVLSRKFATPSPTKSRSSKRITEQLNIRVTPDTRAAFMSF